MMFNLIYTIMMLERDRERESWEKCNLYKMIQMSEVYRELMESHIPFKK